MGEPLRINRPSVDEFWARVAERRPFVMTGIWNDDHPLREVSSFHEFERRYGEVKLPFLPPYDEEKALALAGSPPESQDMSVGAYAALLRSGAAPRIYTSPLGVPDGLETLLDRVPAYCTSAPQPSPLSPRVQLHMSAPGCATLLHFDGWGAHTIHHEIFGTKKWFLIPPEAGAQLSPYGALSLVALHHQSEAYKRDFVERLGGLQIDLQPGESLYFPPEWWHQVEYHEPSCGVSYIFGRNLFVMFMSRETHRNYMMGQINAKLIYESEASCRYLPELIELQAVCRREDFAEPADRYRAVMEALRRMYRSMYPGGVTQTHPVLEYLEQRIALEQDGFYGEFRTNYQRMWRDQLGLPLWDFWPSQTGSGASVSS
ncbi:MAG: hypothetical protein JWO36_2843 [Myxococcales bacterium]|nr:hypothetical protein [Myxococcales bacterium]